MMDIIRCIRCHKSQREQASALTGAAQGAFLGSFGWLAYLQAPLCFYKVNNEVVCSDCLHRERMAQELPRKAKEAERMRQEKLSWEAVNSVDVAINKKLTFQEARYIESIMLNRDKGSSYNWILRG